MPYRSCSVVDVGGSCVSGDCRGGGGGGGGGEGGVGGCSWGGDVGVVVGDGGCNRGDRGSRKGQHRRGWDNHQKQGQMTDLESKGRKTNNAK